MAKANKRTVLETLTKVRLVELAREFELGLPTNYAKADFIEELGRSKAASFRKLLEVLSLEELRDACEVSNLPRSGNKARLAQRLLGEDGYEDEPAEALPLLAHAGVDAQKQARDADQPEPEEAEGEDEGAAPVGPAATAAVEIESVSVIPRRPRLVWRGMERQQVASFVPTQVVEIVHPGRAMKTAGSLPGMDTRAATAPPRAEDALPPNRLIWTNDNLVALQTLLDERDPKTKDFRYRGKVDLVYIDPPFMVNNDFRADNSIDIDIDPGAGVQARKEPSLVEMLAYKDTWREGLDSFLSMLRARLVRLKELLAPTGSIYVHLDWHAVHYVKVLMDEVFGYEMFRGEVVWKRTFARSDAQGFNLVHDTLLAYSSGANPYWNPVLGPHAVDYIRSHYNKIDEATGRRYQLTSLESPSPRPNMMYEWKGYASPVMGWRYSKETMARMDADGLIYYPARGGKPRFRRFLDDDGMPMQSIWTDISPVNSQAAQRLGFPTQKPVDLVERVIESSCPPAGLVVDCFMGSGTTAEAAERLGRRWIGIDNGKYAIHLARKRLIQLHGQPRPAEKPQYDYVECEHCRNIERKEKSQKSPGPYEVRPFTLENMGVYQRAEAWQDFQTERSRYRDEMIRVFGGEPTNASPLLHGIKRNSWVHVGPLDAPVASAQVWSIAREAQRTDKTRVTILSADFDTLSFSEKQEVEDVTGIAVTIRVIPSSAIDEVRRRIELLRKNPDVPLESMAVPAFYAPLAISLRKKVSGRHVRIDLARCEVDIESFTASQRPVLKSVASAKTPSQRKKAEAALKKWQARETQLEAWLQKADTWEKFVDFWAIDWDYDSRVGPDGKPIFQTQWQSFRVRKSKSQVDPLVFHAELTYDQPGQYRIAARVTDVFGNDGIATVTVDVR